MIDFYGKRWYFFGLSILILIIGIVSFIVNGFVMDIDFKGGTIIEVNIGTEFDNNKLADVAKQAIGKDVTIQKMGQNQTQAAIKSEPLQAEEREKLFEAVKAEYNLKDEDKLRTSDVQPLMGEEMRQKGFLAVTIASILMLIYIAARFRKISGLSAGTASILGLLHDAFVMMVVYSLFGIPVNSSFVAAILTILGYSINDTIIIYDRIRENQSIYKKATLPELVNISINQTLTRTIYTVITSTISLLCLYVAGVYYGIQSIKDFVFPLLIGMVSGSYSSLCVICPLWVMWREGQTKRRIAARASKA